MFRKKLLILLFISSTFTSFAETLKVLTPDGLPALALAKMMSTSKEIDGVNLNYKIEKISDALIVDMLKREGDIAIVPSNFSAQLYNKKLDYKILGTVGWGSFYVVSRKNIDSLEALKGEKVYTFGKGLTPDIIFQTILKRKNINTQKDLQLNYLSGGNELSMLFLSKKIDTIVIPEPMLSKVLSKDLTAHIVSNLNDEWKNMIASDLGYPQSTIVIKTEILEHNPELVDKFVKNLKEDISEIYQNKEATLKYITENNITFDVSLYKDIIKRANINYTPIIDCLEEYNSYFKTLSTVNSKVIGGKVPNEEIYAK